MKLSTLDAQLEALTPTLCEVRHDLHKHPELGFEERRTQAIVRDWLVERGYTPRACAETGLVADLHPDSQGPTIALRADLDCLPMQETTDLPYRSIHDGRAHKCGHDGHTAILMGVADILARQREAIPGNVRLLFQPAEEGVRGGGALVMVDEGAISGVDEVYGLHNWPGFPRGEVRVVEGPTMAQVHNLDLVVRGVGGHASQPQRCRDPVVAAAHIITALQTVVARGLGYQGGAVVSVTMVHAGDSHNIIPEVARLRGTVRSFEPETTARVVERIKEIVDGCAVSFGVSCELHLEALYPVVVNAPRCVDAVRRVAASIVGDARVSGAGLPMAASEDFAYFAQKIPAAYFFLGAGEEGEETPVCHHPDFDFDDALIPLGVRMFLGLVHDRMAALRT
ncbi:MAG: amidohydrolase [Nannocystaceae bacterium]|nr:amidohydrolase [Myxococcales bacterium]